MRRFLWACFALGALWAIYRTALSPQGSSPEVLAPVTEEKESAAQQLVYLVSTERPLLLMISPGASHSRLVTVLDLKASDWIDADKEYAYSYRVTILDGEGKTLRRNDYSERTRKIRVPAPGGYRENVSYGVGDLLACEPRTTILELPAGASRLRLEWAGESGGSGAVRGLEKVASQQDPGTLYRRWESLSPEARERLGGASALGTAELTLQEKIAALAHPWKRMIPVGNPGREYSSRHLYLSPAPIEYVPPARRPEAAPILAAATSPPPPPAVWNLLGPGEVELTWRPLTPPRQPAPSAVAVRVLGEDGVQKRLLVPLELVAGERRGRFGIGPGLRTLEVEPSMPGAEGAGVVLRTRAREIHLYSTGPVAPSTLPVELAPASMLLRSWRAGPATSAVNPEIEVVVPPGGNQAILKVSARTPATSGPLSGQELGMELLDRAGAVIGQSSAQLTPVSSPDDRPRSGFGPAQGAMRIATAVILLDRGVHRVRFWSKPESALSFYTQLDDPLEVRPDRRARDRRAGILRWAQEEGRRWHALRPSNGPELERQQRVLDIATALRALSSSGSLRATPPADWDATPLIPREPLLTARLLEPLAPSSQAVTTGDTGLLWPIASNGRSQVSRRHPRFPGLEVPYRGRLLWQAAAPTRAIAPLQLHIGGILVASVRPATRAGDVQFEGAPALPAPVELTGSDPAAQYFLSLPPSPPTSAAPWRERTYTVLRSGDSMTLELFKEAGRDSVVNLVVAPFRGSHGASVSLTATLEGPPPRTREIFSRMTQPSQTLIFSNTGESDAIPLDLLGAGAAGSETAFLTLAEDRPPGRYRWHLRVARGAGALLRAFEMKPIDSGEGRAWLTSRR